MWYNQPRFSHFSGFISEFNRRSFSSTSDVPVNNKPPNVVNSRICRLSISKILIEVEFVKKSACSTHTKHTEWTHESTVRRGVAICISLFTSHYKGWEWPPIYRRGAQVTVMWIQRLSPPLHKFGHLQSSVFTYCSLTLIYNKYDNFRILNFAFKLGLELAGSCKQRLLPAGT